MHLKQCTTAFNCSSVLYIIFQVFVCDIPHILMYFLWYTTAFISSAIYHSFQFFCDIPWLFMHLLWSKTAFSSAIYHIFQCIFRNILQLSLLLPWLITSFNSSPVTFISFTLYHIFQFIFCNIPHLLFSFSSFPVIYTIYYLIRWTHRQETDNHEVPLSQCLPYPNINICSIKNIHYPAGWGSRIHLLLSRRADSHPMSVLDMS